MNRIVRPRFACSGCETFTQASLPSRPIERGRPGPGLLAHVLVNKYADHLPLYRQSQIFERDGLDLDRSTLADWVGKSTALLEPLADAIGRHVLAGQAIFADDTPVRMLAPGTGKTATARLWAYGRDERPWSGSAPPASWYRFSPDRKGQHPKDHLAGYRGWMHADGYAGFEDLYRSGDIREVACMAHVRRKFVDIHRAQGSAIAEEAIARIAQLYAVEKEARRSPPDKRVEIRQAGAKPVFDDLEAWLHVQLPSISGKSPLAVAIRYGLTRMKRVQPYLNHGVLELDNNTAERAMRSVAIGRKNYLFVGSLTGGRAAAIAYTLASRPPSSTASTRRLGSPIPSPPSRTTRSPAWMTSCRGMLPSRSSQPGRLLLTCASARPRTSWKPGKHAHEKAPSAAIRRRCAATTAGPMTTRGDPTERPGG